MLIRIRYKDNLLISVDWDGCTGSQISAKASASFEIQTSGFEFYATDWLPHELIKVRPSRKNAENIGCLQIPRSETETLTLPIDKSGCLAELIAIPSFVPAQIGYDLVDRKLSILLSRCSLVSSTGKRVNPFLDDGA